MFNSEFCFWGSGFLCGQSHLYTGGEYYQYEDPGKYPRGLGDEIAWEGECIKSHAMLNRHLWQRTKNCL